MTSSPRQLNELTDHESYRLLGSVSFGRIAFTLDALPAIRPVNHLVECGDVIIRSRVGAAMLSTPGQVVAYEADAIDPDRRTGWSVIVTGMARVVEDPGEVGRYQRMLRPWVNRTTEYVVRIHPEIVTGYALVDCTVA